MTGEALPIYDDEADVEPDWFLRDDGGRGTSKRPKQGNDCAVRAIAVATARPYDEVYDRLARAGRKSHRGTETAMLKVLYRLAGFEWEGYKAERGKIRMHPDSFCASHPDGRYIVTLAHHEVAVIDGRWHDLYVPYEDRCVYGAWRVPNIGRSLEERLGEA